MYHLSVSQLLFFFHYCLPKGLFRFLPSIALHGILLPQIYCVSVNVQWPFGRPQTIIISRIIFTLPRTSLLSPLRMYDVCVCVDIWGGRVKACYAWVSWDSVFLLFCQVIQKATLGLRMATSNCQTLNICLGVQYYILID